VSKDRKESSFQFFGKITFDGFPLDIDDIIYRRLITEELPVVTITMMSRHLAGVIIIDHL
jgi:hypothetical protein